MNTEWEHYQRRARGFIEKATRALRDDEVARADVCLLVAAENLYRAARAAPEQLKEELVEKAESVLRVARGEGRGKESVGKTSRGEEGNGTRPWQVVRDTGVSLKQVAGLEGPKRAIYNMVIRPLADPEGAKRWGQGVGGGILLYGPPGTGKTLFARAIAGELKIPFLNVVGSALLNKWVGEAEKNVDQLFNAACDYDQCVVFIDEVEALLPKRGSGSTVMDRVVPTFLSAMDGIAGREEGLILLGATNRPDVMDPAALRHNRFEHQVYVGLPNAEARRRILESSLDGIPLSKEADLAAIAKNAEGYSGADLAALVEEAKHHAWDREQETKRRTRLTREDFQRGLEATPPSVTENDLETYEKFRRSHHQKQ
jgi:transitional endoplasmic reticulum ATPase